jgi:hypothetical protein
MGNLSAYICKGEINMKRIVVCTALLALTMSGCATKTQTGALVGTGVVAAVGVDV